MNSHLFRNVVVAVIGLLVIGAVWLGLRGNRAVLYPTPAGTSSTTVPSSTVQTPADADVTHVKVALLDYTGSKPGISRGCDHVVLVDRTVPATAAPLTAALQELFAIQETQVGDLGSFIPKTRATLGFDHATVDNGVAKIYLLGKLSGLGGECDDPRAKAQIEETALQFPTVKSVELYLNGTKTTLQPSLK